MGVFGLGHEDHQVGYVDDADAEGGGDCAEKLGGFDDFEGDFYADAYEDDVGVCGWGGGGPLPDGCA